VTVTYSVPGSEAPGEVTATLTIRPARLQLYGIEVESKVYDATTDAEYTLEYIYLSGIFGNDDVTPNIENAAVRFRNPDADTNAPVFISGISLTGEDMHNYYLVMTTVSAEITPRPLYLSIEADSRVYDGTTIATVTGDISLSGVLADDDVRIDPTTPANFVQATVGEDIAVDISADSLIGTHAHNYYIAEIEGFGNIYPRPITIEATVPETRVYDATTAFEVTDAQLINVVTGDDVSIVTLDAGALSTPDVGEREVTFSFELEGDDAFNYTLIQPQDVTVEITPKPITVDVEVYSTVTMTNEANILGTTLNTIYARDTGLVSLAYGYFALFTPRTYLPPPNERFVNVHFHNFILEGARAFNYKLVPPETDYMELDRGLMPGMVQLQNRDSRLRIGSQLYFSHDIPFFSPSLWERIWFVGGRDEQHIVARGFGMDTMDLDVIHQYVDQRVYLKLVSVNDRYEVWAVNPTDYVPFTIVAGIDQQSFGGIMGSDDVFMNNSSNQGATRRQTYSASHGRHIDIEFNLWGLPNGRNSIYFDNPQVANTRNSATALRSNARYNVNPADAIDGVIRINATFVHRGVNLGTSNHTFPNVNCGFTVPSHTLTVSNTGNAPTNAITVSRTNPAQYNISSATIPSLPIGGITSIAVSPVAGQFANAPGATEAAIGTRTITSTVTITGADIIARTANYSMTINHSLPVWAGQHGTASHCQRRCTHAACNALHSLEHVIPVWTMSHALNSNVTDAGRCGTRACTRCGNNNTSNSHRSHSWSGWGTWGHGDASNHHRSRSCDHPGCNQVQNIANFALHNNVGVRSAHDESTIGGWTHGTAAHHTRTRHCNTCGRFMRDEIAEHSWPLWSPAQTTRCISQTFTQNRNCTICNRGDSRSVSGTRPHSFPGSTTGLCTTYTANCDHGCGAERANRFLVHSFLGSTTGICGTYTATCTRAGCSHTRTNRHQSHNLGGWVVVNRSVAVCQVRSCSRIDCDHEVTEGHNWQLNPGTNVSQCTRCPRTIVAGGTTPIDCNWCGEYFMNCDCSCFACDGSGCDFCN